MPRRSWNLVLPKLGKPAFICRRRHLPFFVARVREGVPRSPCALVSARPHPQAVAQDRLFRAVERVAAFGLVLGLVMGSSEVHAAPSAAPPQPRPGKPPCRRSL